ncbi:MAG: 50S ribosome-binding GTPase [Candidatus Nanoarchaeia archaeon]|nr:50S ribosome-binding GTPase [Candidatus Nanoarchaeia archaeon]
MGANANTNIEPYWDLIKRIIQESDILLEILDARLVELSRNEEVEKLISEVGRPIIFVINKTDLADKNKVKEQVLELEKKGEVVYISAKDKSSFKILLYMIKKVFSEYGKRKGTEKPLHREAKADIVVGVLGYPNVGKSSIINLLCHRKKAKVSRKPGTTHGIHWIRATPEIKLIDSPGVIPLSKEDDIRYGLIGARGEETLRHPDVVAYAVIRLFLEKNKKKLEKFYDIVIEDENPEEIILQIARRRNFLIKGGELDENRVFSLIVRDWQDGTLRL